MIDLSNNNAGAVNFAKVRAEEHQRRVYLKLTEGAGFVDGRHADYLRRAHRAGFLVGEYHFARPSSHTPSQEAEHFLTNLRRLVAGQDLRPCLDLEDPDAHPSPRIGRWAVEWIRLVRRHSKHVPVVYGSPSYLAACSFERIPGPLWLAAYGRNDGHEHPFTVPRPWHHVAAHQFASTARVVGIAGPVDLSHVYVPAELDVATTH